MLHRLFGHMRQNAVAYLALFVALGGTSAYAANTIRTGDIVDNEVFTTDVRDDTLGFGGLYHQDLGPGSVRSSEIEDFSIGNGDLLDGSIDSRALTDESVTSTDIKDSSLGNGDFLTGSVNSRVATDNSLTGTDINESTLQGVKDGDSCGSSGAAFFSNARLCAGSDGVNRSVDEAHTFCTSIKLRLPTWGEAVLLARGDVPGVTPPDFFWTDEIAGYDDRVNDYFVLAVNEDGVDLAFSPPQNSRKTVCVTTPD